MTVKQFVKQYEAEKGSKLELTLEASKLLEEALELQDAESGDDLVGYVTDDYFSDLSLEEALQSYIDDKKPEEEQFDMLALASKQIETSVKTITDKQITKIRMEVDSRLKKNDEFIKSHVDNFIKETYGAIERKVTVDVEVGKVKTKFKEVLHPKFDKCLELMANGIAPFLTGEAGTGKSVLAKQLAKAIHGDDKHFFFANAVQDKVELTGFVDAYGVYRETEFYKAFKNGGVFMLDEMDASIPDVLNILNSALANRWFPFPQGVDKNGNKVGGLTYAHADFRVISAGNTFGTGADMAYVGRQQLDFATLDRFLPVKIDYDKTVEMSIAEGNADLVDFCEDVRRVKNESGIMMLVSYRAIGNLTKIEKMKSFTLEEAVESAIVKHLTKDDINTILSGMKVNNKYTEALRTLAK